MTRHADDDLPDARPSRTVEGCRDAGTCRPRRSGAWRALPLLALSAAAAAQAVPPAPAAGEPVIVPQVERRDLKLPRIPSKDFEIGAFGGLYNAQNFGASGLGGLRLGYHVTEDVFVEGEVGRTRVSDASFRAILPGGVLASGRQSLDYGTLSVGVNVLPGEVFLGSRQARTSQLYLLGGIGSTDFVGQKRQTFAFGLGVKVLAAQRLALRVDLRDHVYTLDLLGQRERTHNLQMTAGVAWFY